MTDPAGATRIFETIPGTIPGECGSDLETAKAIIARLSAAELAELAPSFTSAAIRIRARRERGAALRALAALTNVRRNSGRGLIETLRSDLGRYHDSAWLFEEGRPPPADPRRALWHQVLTATKGDVPSKGTIGRALRGID